MGLFANRAPGAAGAPAAEDYARALHTDFVANRKQVAKWQAAEPDGMRSALRRGETIEAVIPGHWGVLAVTDWRLMWIVRGQVRARCARADVRFVAVTPGPKHGYEVVLQDRDGAPLGVPTHKFSRLDEAEGFHRLATPRAQPKVTLGPEDLA